MSNNCKFCGVDVTRFRWCQNRACKLYNARVRATQGAGSALCKRCNGLLAFTNPCPECLRNDPASILKRFEQADREALKAGLGYSSDVKWRTFNEDAGDRFGEQWQGYRLELLGIELGRYSQWPIPAEGLSFFEQIGAIALKSEGGYDILRPALLLPFTCIPDHEDRDLIIELCRIRAWYKDSPLYSEMRPGPYGVRRVAIYGLENRHSKADLDKAFEGLDLLRAAAKRKGRSKGRSYSKSDFRRRVLIAYRAIYDRTGEYPNSNLLAAEMHVSRSTFFEHLKDCELTMPKIRALAMK